MGDAPRWISPLATSAALAGLLLAAACQGESDSESSGYVVGLPARPVRLAFVVQPRNGVAMRPLPAVQVALVAATGARVRDDSFPVTIALGNTHQITLGGTRTRLTVNGVASFDDLTIDRAWTDFKDAYTLTASSPTLERATSSGFVVFPGPAAVLRVSLDWPWSSTGATASAPFSAYAWVTDDAGNYLESAAIDVTLAIGANPAEGTLSGTMTAPLSDYYATFTDLVIDQPGVGYTLTASAAGLPGATTGPFTVRAPTSVRARP
ncbi:MAG: hypothetical protein A2085_02190 [Gemmatimonadetes bacterium GWC2_71_10]|nr:MAG: hypothetical protein A2085_02190 [Gemmatimonadetes bacterium GWC2_71_10]